MKSDDMQMIVEEVYRLRKLLLEADTRLPVKSLTFLTDFMHRINTQDNRGTATPIYYTIHERVECATAQDYADKSFWVDVEGQQVAETEDDLREYIKNKIIEDYDPVDVDQDVPERPKRLAELAERDDYDLADYAEEELELRKVYIKYEDKYTGVFFTEQACEKHIKENHYHYNNPRSYVMHAWRNQEFEQLLEILGVLVGQPYVKH